MLVFKTRWKILLAREYNVFYGLPKNTAKSFLPYFKNLFRKKNHCLRNWDYCVCVLCFLSCCKGKRKGLPKTGLSGAECWLLKAQCEVHAEFNTEINVQTQGEHSFFHHCSAPCISLSTGVLFCIFGFSFYKNKNPQYNDRNNC